MKEYILAILFPIFLLLVALTINDLENHEEKLYLKSKQEMLEISLSNFYNSNNLDFKGTLESCKILDYKIFSFRQLKTCNGLKIFSKLSFLSELLKAYCYKEIGNTEKFAEKFESAKFYGALVLCNDEKISLNEKYEFDYYLSFEKQLIKAKILLKKDGDV